MVVSTDCQEAAASFILDREECLDEIHDLYPYSLIMEIPIDTETADLYGRVTSEMLLVRDLFSNSPEYPLFAVFAAYPVIENTEEGYGLLFVLKYICDCKKLAKIIKSVLVKKFVEVGISAIERLYL